MCGVEEDTPAADANELYGAASPGGSPEGDSEADSTWLVDKGCEASAREYKSTPCLRKGLSIR